MTNTIGERTVQLQDEFERLDEELDDYAETIADADDGAMSAQAIRKLAGEVEQQLEGVAYLIGEYGEDATVTVQGLDSGAFARVEDRVADIRASRDGQGGAPGGTRNVYAASGLVDAPFVERDASYEDRLEAVAGQPVGVAEWARALVDEESSLEKNEYRSFSERLADTSTD